jgi:putative ubiquitin-RnfH superfamily antitoxin RatB of RatAB toxin-antitoxin module
MPKVEVVYALAKVQRVVTLNLPASATAKDAAAASGLPHEGLQLGIFGRRVAPARTLKDGDRVEILRPLAEDPKEARRRRARKR